MLSKYPKPLIKGSTIGLICPASGLVNYKQVYLVVRYLKSLGFKVKLGKLLIAPKGLHSYLSGPDELRAKDFITFWNAPFIDAIFCLRGGYGCLRMLDHVDFSIIKNKRKIFLGFSDITVLLLAIYAKCRLITFHGPLLGYKFLKPDLSVFDESTERNLWKILNNHLFDFSYSNKLKGHVINPGKASGVLLGGNLTDLCSMIGSSYLPLFKNSILFLEDCNEEPYKIDRLLTQLDNDKIFEVIKGVIFSSFYNCKFKNNNHIVRFIKEKMSRYKYPIIYGFPIGHENKNYTVPIGKEVLFDADNLILKSC